MLLWLTIGIAVISLIVCVTIDNNYGPKWLVMVFAWVLAACVIALFIMGIILGVNYFGVEGYIASCNVRYDMLVYQLENDVYDNDNDLGKRELMVDIQNWNEDLARYRANQDNFWIGVFTPNIYDAFEFIELE